MAAFEHLNSPGNTEAQCHAPGYQKLCNTSTRSMAPGSVMFVGFGTKGLFSQSLVSLQPKQLKSNQKSLLSLDQPAGMNFETFIDVLSDASACTASEKFSQERLRSREGDNIYAAYTGAINRQDKAN
ncbi:MAG: hypothetical protein E5X53_32035 [Mesorhizobium sp.]|uniref:hypothetical protein n=1 Tax=Mesorhizobium sp. TaxID=1871066 RepID=UPI0012143B6D|nr:hypothetical protein [Mesorhizobium sp.]TIP69686.1 MAG: hypothetical protein E5X55_31085 [Mesorhizobium sp.]TIR47876.1 MAG: hypothetical protein E5X53_32035 [Mesorhizobium sp.]TJV96808.1 MAG: hypothetical protein E5X52_17400 [Mesorhizobium sp.]